MIEKRKILKKIFERVIGCDSLYKNIPRSEIPQWDSMRHAELIIALEKEMKIRVSIKDLNEINSFDALEKVILRDS